MVQTGSAYTDPTQVRLLQKLAEITPEPFQKSFLACSGSEANEAAIRIAKCYTRRFEVVSFPGNYHGMTSGSWSATGFGKSDKAPFGPAMPGTVWLPNPFSYPVPGNPRFPERDPAVVDACIRFCEGLLDATTGGGPAAILLELVQSAAGVRMLPKAFVQALRRMCDERGALLIVDEAQTGMGRLGTWWGFELYDIKPDIIVASKTLGGGIPLSAVITSAEIADTAVANGYTQSSSHTGDPLLCAVGLANIGIIEREGLVENARKMGDYLIHGLEAIAKSSPVIGEIRGTGLLLGVEIVRDKNTGEPNPAAIAALTERCRDNGLLTGWWPITTSGREHHSLDAALYPDPDRGRRSPLNIRRGGPPRWRSRLPRGGMNLTRCPLGPRVATQHSADRLALSKGDPQAREVCCRDLFP